MDSRSSLFKLALSLVSGVGSGLAQNLISHVGNVDDIFSEKESNLLKIPGIGTNITKNINNPDILKRAEEEIRFIEKNKINFCFFMDSSFPARLKQCNDAPVVLFYKGTLDTFPARAISIIGTRNPSTRGRRLTRDWVSEISHRDKSIIIISGLAYGIDIQAHEAALDFGLQTYAGLGHGFHTIYPAIHRSTARRIVDNGALLTDFFSYSKMEPKNFIRRNRLIAGLSDVTLVIESKEKGGAIVTAEMANSYNREVMAVPGRPSDPMSIGCNNLIKNNKAALVQSVEDLFFLMDWDERNIKPENKTILRLNDLTEEEKTILAKIGTKSFSIDQISFHTGLKIPLLSATLLNLEFKGLVSVKPGGIYTRLT